MASALRMLSLTWMLLVLTTCWGAEGSSKSDLEVAIREAYEDRGLVQRKVVMVKGEAVEYLETTDGAKGTVIFCHGSAFSMRTWQYVGVLDALGEQGYRGIAVNLPGYGETSRLVPRDSFVRDLLNVLAIREPVVVVAASMGGVFALPFVADDASHGCAGYVSAAGLLAQTQRKGGDTAIVNVPTLFVYGDQDPRLYADSTAVASTFPNSDLVVFENAPHPAYLRDLDAAARFTNLVLAFVGGVNEPALKVHADWASPSFLGPGASSSAL